MKLVLIPIIAILIGILFLVSGGYMLGILCLMFAIGIIFYVYIPTFKELKKADQKHQEKINKELEEFKKMSPEEQEAYYMKKYVYKDHENKNKSCPSCRKVLIYWEGNKRIDEWKLAGSQTVDTKEFDSAYTLGGATTAFYKTKQKTIRKYKCPYCDFERTE